jgi:hypothetical protein
MATVTETYILEQNEGSTNFPASAIARREAAKNSGAVISRTKTPIADPAEVVEGKSRFNMTIIYRSEADRLQIANENDADAELQAYLISSGYRKINRTLT